MRFEMIYRERFMLEQCELDYIGDKVAKNSLEADHAKLVTIKQFCTAFPWPSESAMRSYIYRAEVLGLSEAFVRVGRRVLIMPKSFFSLIKQIESRSTKGGSYETTSWRKGKGNM